MLTFYFLLASIIILFLYLGKQTHQSSITILLYHKFSINASDDLTVKISDFEKQIQFLLEEGFEIIPIESLFDNFSSIEQKRIVITFDDGYLNNLELAYPIIQKYKIPVTIFLPTAFIGKESSWEKHPQKLMSLEQLKSLDSKLVSFGLHSHTHISFRQFGIELIVKELKLNHDFFKNNDLPFAPFFAYPYGAYPKDKITFGYLKSALEFLGLKGAFIVGNGISINPQKNPYLIKRLSVKGDESLRIFKFKIQGLKGLNG
ncbi:polysaccharide deacetylase (plasmid) [Emticicia oligotrophica DSM 17448]|uniref:Polysaccharide deacetylase n=1 Tax=Emticicia oligotrophica (strain DSM 17448 / CIP 109782 / MTCC 6937 / GPTSA100-15) TaxID=929562 RepID=A0ABM5N7R1_EMTOG|nr:polysaccharide deacetylase family protein [Emticicia oligotrophica]AFK05541.1 polysaccharide deacetylase [Emticicia oligotrophica DSM 17448]